MQTTSTPPPGAEPWISTAELNELLVSPAVYTDVVVIDARAPDAFAKEHIAGAVNIHDIFTFLAMSDAAGIEALQTKFVALFSAAGLGGASAVGEKQRVVVCEEGLTTGFAQSCRGYFLLRYLGQPHVSVLNGGLKAWRGSGLPVTADVVPPSPQTFVAKPLDAWLATQKDVEQAVASTSAATSTPTTVLLDVRDKDEWVGESSSPYGRDFAPRKGRLPGAVWIEWYRFMTPPNQEGIAYALPESEVIDLMKSVGVNQRDTNVIVYCFKGSRASNTLLSLQKAGFTNVSNYFASWNEWSRVPELPIDAQVLQA
eukprot:TRINITY_DN4407_c0_g1_i1.p1 TRINITY_DN4407_c0_g1~~TRINITY_DN4407_c0_g1_i1.p1  ORF type:complete len:341 (-),score=73.43 TRINITY_DN4407_c0_g1_i1:10-948(-)